jgi:hypothetical protein
VKWDDLAPHINDSPCDMVIILDCCSAGATDNDIPYEKLEGPSEKHVLVACHEDSTAYGSMSDAMCDCLIESK